MLREPRYKVDIQVDYVTKDLFVANRVSNISRGGVFIQTPLPLHSEVELRFTLPDSEVTIGAKGLVVWNYDVRKDSSHLVCGSGIRFTEMAPQHRALLEAYLEKLARPPATPGLRADAH
jgi:uncharacterized protein (TIGR02266 family)